MARELPTVAVVVLLTGCVLIPIPTEPTVVEGAEVVLPLPEDARTMESVLALLGEPDQRMDDLRVHGYTWAQREGLAVWAIAAPGGGAGGVLPVGYEYLYLVAFDTDDTVLAHARVRKSLSRTPREEARRWLKATGQSLPDPAGKCEAPKMVDGFSGIHLLRPGGWRDFGTWAPLVTVREVGQVGRLDEGRCLSLMVGPGEYTLEFDPVPEPFSVIAEEDSPPHHVAIRTVPGHHTFVKVAVHSGRGDVTVVTQQLGEEDGHSELSRCEPACVDISGSSTFCRSLGPSEGIH